MAEEFIKLTEKTQFPDGIYEFRFRDDGDTMKRIRYGDVWLHNVIIESDELFELFDAYLYKPFKLGQPSKN